MSSLKKNVASQNVTFCLINASTGAALTGATVTVYVTKDNGSQATGSGTVTECGHGQYNYAPIQAETNATDVGFLFTATLAIPVNYDFHTDVVDANGYLGVNVVDINGVSCASVTTVDAVIGTTSANTPQTGDSFARIGSAGSGLTSVALAANGLDLVLIESSIVASSALTNDAGTQLTSINARQALSLTLAMSAAVTAGGTAGSSTITYKPAALPSGNTRITATCDTYGNRTGNTLKVPT